MGMRKDTLITIIMGVISIFTSCNPHPNLSKADQLINFYPDSSLTYLKAIQHPENMSPKDYAKNLLNSSSLIFSLVISTFAIA